MERRIIMAVLNYEPQKVFHFFEEISQVPRGSFHEEKISNYLANWAKERNLFYIQDEFNNIIIKKPATQGYENCAPVILQGHMDMVCEKEPSSTHDFEKDPISLVVDGDFIHADKTTLGADNGIAVAMALAILDSDDIKHPALEAVFTVQEETGLLGATNMNTSSLEGKYFINIDSEEEGELLTSCAGGVRTQLFLPVEWTLLEDNYTVCEISLSNFKGGHSGGEIDKGRGNAILLLGRFLYNLSRFMPFEIFQISGGAKMNAIPRAACATIAIDSENIDKLKEQCNTWFSIYKNEYTNIEDEFEMVYTVKEKNENRFVFNEKTKNAALQLLMLLPNGIQSMSFIINDLVESSLNLGVLTLDDSNLIFESAVRSSVTSRKQHIVSQLALFAKIYGAKFETTGDYPAWPAQMESKLKDLFLQVYKETFSKEMKASAIHAGVECGIFKEKLIDVDMISFGPNMYDVHTPRERLSISSTKRCYQLLLAVLEKMNELEC